MAEPTVPSRRSIAARLNGSKGGQATAKNHSPEWLSTRARNGGNTTRDLYSADFFRHAQQLRKTRRGWPQGKLRKAVETVENTIEKMGLQPESTQLLNRMLAQN